MKKGKGKKSNKDKVKSVLNDYGEVKKAHLKYLADKMLKLDEEYNKLREKEISGSFLDLF